MIGARFPGAGLLALWNRLPGNLRGIVLVVLAGAFYSIMSGLIKHLGGRIPSVEIVFFRAAVVLTLLVPVLTRSGLASLKTRRPRLHFMRVVLTVIALNATYFALTTMPLADFTAITFSRSLFATVFAVIFLGEMVGRHRWVATAAGFVGVIVILRPGGDSFEPAALFALLAACSVAGVMIIVRKLSSTEKMVTMMVYPAVFVVAVMAAPAAWLWVTPTRDELVLLVGMSLISLAAQWCFIQAFRVGETSALAPVDYVRLLFATLVGMAFFGEVPDWATVAGSVIIIASTLYSVRREAKP